MTKMALKSRANWSTQSAERNKLTKDGVCLDCAHVLTYLTKHSPTTVTLHHSAYTTSQYFPLLGRGIARNFFFEVGVSVRVKSPALRCWHRRVNRSCRKFCKQNLLRQIKASCHASGLTRVVLWNTILHESYEACVPHTHSHHS